MNHFPNRRVNFVPDEPGVPPPSCDHFHREPPPSPPPPTPRDTTQEDGAAWDLFAAAEHLSEWDDPDAVMLKELAEAITGDKQPEGGWTAGNLVVMVKWECKWRAALKALRADAMMAERAKRRVK